MSPDIKNDDEEMIMAEMENALQQDTELVLNSMKTIIDENFPVS